MRISTSFNMQTTSYIIMEARDRVRDWAVVSQGKKNRVKSNGETGETGTGLGREGEGRGE